MTQGSTVTGVILAGGRASRMGGRDKGLIELQGRPLLAHVIQALSPQVNRLLINANRNLARYRRFGYPVIPDSLPDHPGPLAGMLAALQQCDSEYLLSVPCDSPRLPADLCARLLSAIQETDAEVACVYDGDRLHPVFALLRRRLCMPLEAALAQGERAVYRWFNSRRLVQVDFSDCAERFANINTAQDLQRIAGQTGN
jgi:molybdopterin-guanine dinucleotide biosynthesis protein A